MAISVPSLEIDAQAFADVAGGDDAKVAVASNGRQIPSMLKVIKDQIRWKPSVLWSASVSVTEVLQPYESVADGHVYAPAAGKVPFTAVLDPSADPTNWFLMQGYMQGSGGDLDLAGGDILNLGQFTSDVLIAAGLQVNAGFRAVINSTLAEALTAKAQLRIEADHSADEASISFQDAASSNFLVGTIEAENAFYMHVGATLATGMRLWTVNSAGQWGLLRDPVGAVTLAVNETIEIIGDSSFAGLFLRNFSNTAGQTGAVIFNRARGTETLPLAVQANDVLGALNVRGYDGAGFDDDGNVIDVVATENHGALAHGKKIQFKTVANGAVVVALRATLEEDGGLFMAGATGASQGAGTINATGVFDDGALLTCYVADAVIDGKIDIDAWDARVPDRQIPAVHEVQPILDEDGEPILDEDGEPLTEVVEIAAASTEFRTHDAAARFKDRMGRDMDPRLFFDDLVSRKALPAFPTRTEWADKGPLSTGDIIQRLWETVELYAVHMKKDRDENDTLRKTVEGMARRITALENTQ